MEVIVDYNHNRNKTPFAKQLRKNMTKEERHLWYDFLRNHPIKFYRQKVVGPYIVDFYCAKAELVIELDGSQHFTDQVEYDRQRTEYLNNLGLYVIRLPNNEVMQNFRGVCEHIDHIIAQRLD